MIVKEITVHNFRNFVGTHTFIFRKLNLLVGKIGSGKSTIGRIAITFALFGESEVNNSDLISKGYEYSYVELKIKYKHELIIIKREIPTKLSVTIDSIPILDLSTNVEKDKWLKEKFKDYNYFKKFRMIDLKQGINILDEGKTSLRKTLISFNESILNNIRVRLLEKKSIYEKFNRDSAVVFSHYPSDKRHQLLKNKLSEYTNEYNGLYTNVQSLKKDLYSLSCNKGKLQSDAIRYKSGKVNVEKNTCPTCNQIIENKTKENLLVNLSNQINDVNEKLKELEEYIVSQEDAINHCESRLKETNEITKRINNLIFKLEARLKQKNFKYTDKDIILVSNAIKELDKFYSYFILNSVKILEPVINNVISKINFEVNFQLDSKGNFDIILLKDNKSYSYKELSSGQKTLLSIAFQIALLLDKGDTGIIVADEGFNNLAQEDIVQLYELFTELPFQLISILHRVDQELITREVNIITMEEVKDYAKF